MGAPKGSRNPKKYQETQQTKREIKVSQALLHFSKKRLYFEKVTPLSEAVSNATQISASALRRNTLYRSYLEAYLSQQTSSSSFHSVKKNKTTEITKLNLQLICLKNDISRLKNYIAVHRVDNQGTAHHLTEAPNNNELHLNAALETISLLVEHIDGLDIDWDNKTILDRGGIIPNQIIVPKKLGLLVISRLQEKLYHKPNTA